MAERDLGMPGWRSQEKGMVEEGRRLWKGKGEEEVEKEEGELAREEPKLEKDGVREVGRRKGDGKESFGLDLESMA